MGDAITAAAARTSSSLLTRTSLQRPEARSAIHDLLHFPRSAHRT